MRFINTFIWCLYIHFYEVYKYISGKSVYFSVSLSDHKSLRGKNIVKFDKVFSNSGSGYSSSTGIFTAPYSGPYLFLFFVRPGRDIFELAYLQLYVDGRYRAYIIQGNTFGSIDNMAGQAYVEYMSAGDKAWIQTGELKEDAFQVVYSGGSTFTGVLINWCVFCRFAGKKQSVSKISKVT